MDKFCPGQQSDHFSAEFEVKREKLLVNWGDYQWYTSDTALTSIVIFEWTLDTKGDERSSRHDSLHLTTLRHKFLRPPTLAWCMSNPSWQWIFSPQGQQKLRRLSTEVESILSTSNALMTLKGVDSTSQIQLCTSVFTKSLAQSCVWSCLNWRTHLRIHEIHETGFVRPISLVGLIDLLQKTVANKNPNLHSDLADSTPNSPLLLHKATLTRGWWRLTIPCEVALGQEAATCQAIGSASLEQRLKHHKTWTSTQSIHIESYSHIKFPANIDAIVNIRWPLPASPLAKKCQGRIAGSHNIGLHSCHRAHKDWKTSRIELAFATL